MQQNAKETRRFNVDFFIASGKSYTIERRSHVIKMPASTTEADAAKRLQRVYPKARKIEVTSLKMLKG